MEAKEAKDPLKDVDWKSMSGVGNFATSYIENSQPTTTKRLSKKIRQIPYYYFICQRTLPKKAIGFYGSFVIAGVGTGMLLEVWINKRVKVDGSIIWEFEK